MSKFPTILKGVDIKRNAITAMIYAHPGVGKTTLLGSLPGKTLILDVDLGTLVLSGNKNVDIIRVSENMSELKSTLEWLKSLDDIPYDNICIDTLTEIESGMLTVYGREGKNNGAPELGHYNQVQFKLLDYARQYRSLGKNLIFTAWETNKDVVNKSGEIYTQSRPALSGQGSDKICGLCDIVGKMMISKKNGGRYVWLNASDEMVAKDRVWGREFCKYNELLVPPKSKPKPKPKDEDMGNTAKEDDNNGMDV